MKVNFVKRLCVSFWILIFCSFATEAALKTKYIEEICDFRKEATINFNLDKSYVLASKQALIGKGSLECHLTIEPKYRSSVVLSIFSYNISPGHQLTIEDSDRHQISLHVRGDFPNEKKSIVSDGKIIIHYRINDTYPLSLRGFQFTLTQVTDSPCFSFEFGCKNGKCIPSSLLCDGHNHCGDNSDNEKCVPSTENKGCKTPWPRNSPDSVYMRSVIGLGITLGVVIVVFSIVLVILIRRQSSSKNTNPRSNFNGNTRNLHSVTATVPPNAATMLNGQYLRQEGVNVNGQTPNPPMSMFNQIRRSIRGFKSPKRDDNSLEQTKPEAYPVPSMYPNLKQLPSAPAVGGIDNPEFKIKN